MKSIFTFLIVFIAVFSIGNAQESDITEYASFGKEIKANDVKTTAEITEAYQQLSVKDSISTKFSASVTGVCQAKGCWMTLALEDGSEAMVRFKDYGFFMPMDIVGQEVVVNGNAFVEEMSIADQQHYAKDAGQSAEEVAKITTVKKTYSFEADGVLLKK